MQVEVCGQRGMLWPTLCVTHYSSHDQMLFVLRFGGVCGCVCAQARVLFSLREIARAEGGYQGTEMHGVKLTTNQ